MFLIIAIIIGLLITIGSISYFVYKKYFEDKGIKFNKIRLEKNNWINLSEIGLVNNKNKSITLKIDKHTKSLSSNKIDYLIDKKIDNAFQYYHSGDANKSFVDITFSPSTVKRIVIVNRNHKKYSQRTVGMKIKLMGEKTISHTINKLQSRYVFNVDAEKGLITLSK